MRGDCGGNGKKERMKDEPKRQRCRETDGAQRSPKGDTSVRREGINDEG